MVNGMKGRLLKVLGASLLLSAVGLTGFEKPAQAQEILLTGPLAGAPAVRKMRQYRKGRFEIAPQVSFTLLDEYQRTILAGARLNYNITDWLAIGVWGGFGALKTATSLSDEIQGVNANRQAQSRDVDPADVDPNHQLTRTNLGPDFRDQLGSIDWVGAPQITLVPFRGKIGIFQSIYVDTDFYLFGGPAFVGVTERADCGPDLPIPCGPSERVAPGADPQTRPGTVEFEMASRMAIAPTFGIGFQFYFAKWGALGLEWRGLPFSRNTGGFDVAGGGPNDQFPDQRITEADRSFQFNQMISISFGVSLPFDYKISE